MVIAVDAVPPEAHGHVDVLVGGLQGGWEEPDDGGRADFAAGGAHLNIEALQVQTSEDAIFNLMRKKYSSFLIFLSISQLLKSYYAKIQAPKFFSDI